MGRSQQYVSSQLFHFVGRGRDREYQYQRLVKVLRTRRLSKHPHYDHNLMTFQINSGAKISEDEMYRTGMICFCDIPEADLDLHMAKYSRFGLAFNKAYLVTLGATPVFYVANDSPAGAPYFDGPVPRAEIFDTMAQSHYRVLGRVKEVLAELPGSDANSQLLKDVMCLECFLEMQVYSFVKCFTVAGIAEDDPKNYYMEREWRVLGNFDFALGEVTHVIVPESYQDRLRSDVPEFSDRLCAVPDTE